MTSLKNITDAGYSVSETLGGIVFSKGNERITLYNDGSISHVNPIEKEFTRWYIELNELIMY